jgi:hypothetical protein
MLQIWFLLFLEMFLINVVCCKSYYRFCIILLWGRPRKQHSQLTFISVPSYIHLAALISHTISRHCFNTLQGTHHFLRSKYSGTESLYEMFSFLHLHVCLDFCSSRVYVFTHFLFFSKTKHMYPFFIFIVHKFLRDYTPPPSLWSQYLFLISLCSIIFINFLCSSHPSLCAYLAYSHAP